jgi:CPA2 family monovalent cation:H+ antiporter-2
MHGAHVLIELVIVLGTALVTSILFQALRQPVTLGYLLAGVLIGPHVPVPLVADTMLVNTLSELGVILLMFSIGLEFSVRTIARVGPGAALTAALEVALMVSLGYLLGLALGWTGIEALFLGGCIGISSTMLVARALEEQKGPEGFAGSVFAILVFEDLLAIVLLAILTAVASGVALSGNELGRVLVELGGFLAALLVGGLLVVPRVIRLIHRLGRSETLLIASLAVCFGMAALAEEAGYSVALGAFVGGMLVAESGRGHDVDALIRPFRDVFTAVFFVAIGMTIVPEDLATHWLPIVAISAVVIAGKAFGVTLGSFLAGQRMSHAVRAGLTLTQIGEFSFIIAVLGVESGATRGFILPVAVGVSCLTAFSTPWLVRGSDRASSWLDEHLPRRLQTFVTFYTSWIERLRTTKRPDTLWRRIRAPLMVLLVDAALVGAIAIAGVLVPRRYDGVARMAMIVGAVIIGALFLFGVARAVRKLARLLAAEVIPTTEDGKLDLGNAPRRVLFLTLELGIVLLVGLPLAAVTAPFLPAGGALLAFVLLIIALTVWRAAAGLHGHVRAGSALIVEALAAQSHAPAESARLDHVEAMLPGFAGLSPFKLAADSPAVGRTLAELDLRARTGATVLAITRESGGTALPTAGEVLRAGDVLALAGSDEAVAAAREALSADRVG